MSVWDTFGMKTEIILGKTWIQTSRKGYGNRFDEFLKFLLEGGRVYNFVFLLGAVFFVKNHMFCKKKKKKEMGRHKAPRAHI